MRVYLFETVIPENEARVPVLMKRELSNTVFRREKAI